MAQSTYRREEKLALMAELREKYEETIRNNDCVSLKTLKVTGKDVIEKGVEAGPKVGEILKELLEEVLDDPKKNDREYLLKRLDDLRG